MNACVRETDGAKHGATVLYCTGMQRKQERVKTNAELQSNKSLC